jgi:hypothetical protein
LEGEASDYDGEIAKRIYEIKRSKTSKRLIPGGGFGKLLRLKWPEGGGGVGPL